MDKTKLKSVLEALLFVSTEPFSAAQLKDLVMKGKDEAMGDDKKDQSPEDAGSAGQDDPAVQLESMQSRLQEEVSASEVRTALHEIMACYRDDPEKGFELAEVAMGFQFRTKEGLSPYIRNLYRIPRTRLTTPGMETLAIVAYQQPITRATVEEIRGVDSGGVIKTLLDKDLVRIVGRSDEPGRPILYGTTPVFLEVFGLNSLSDLPTLKDLEALSGDHERPLTSSPETGANKEDQTVSEEEEAVEEFVPLDSDSAELVNELENTMRNLKDLESNIFPKETHTAEIQPAEGNPPDSDLPEV